MPSYNNQIYYNMRSQSPQQFLHRLGHQSRHDNHNNNNDNDNNNDDTTCVLVLFFSRNAAPYSD